MSPILASTASTGWSGRATAAALRLGLLAVCLVVAAGPSYVLVNGEKVSLSQVATAADCAAAAGVSLAPGNLLDITDAVIKTGGGKPGIIICNGTAASPDTVLAAGDVVTVLPGEDTTEPIQERVELLPCRPVAPDLRPTVAAEGIESFHGLRRVRRGTLSGRVGSIEVAQIKPVVIARCRPSTTKAIALTFDDGPHPTYTPQLLEILAKHRAKATFFVLGIYARKYPHLVRRQVADGHEVALHSWAPASVTQIPGPTAAEDIARCKKLIHGIVGRPVALNWFRPPYGGKNATVEGIVAEAGLRMAMWSVDPADWRRPGSEVIYRRVVSRAHSGAVVRFHDGPANREGTVKAVERIIPMLQQQGYKLVTMSELAGLVPIFTGEVYLDTGAEHIHLAPAAEEMRVIIDGEPIEPAQPLLIGDGQLLLPLEPIIERLGASYEWDQERQVVTISGLRGTVRLSLVSRRAEKDGQAITLRIPPVLFRDAAFIPLWAVVNITGAETRYDPAEAVLEMNSALTARPVLQSSLAELDW